MRTAISRRGVVATLAAGAAANLPVIATVAATGAAEPPDALDALWRHRTALVAQSHALAAQMAAAVASMPEWARPGPAYIDGKGRPCGETVPLPHPGGCPAAAHASRPPAGPAEPSDDRGGVSVRSAEPPR